MSTSHAPTTPVAPDPLHPLGLDPQRLDAVREATARARLDALLVTPGPDLRWLVGYDAPALERLTCLVLPVDGPAALVVPALEEPRAAASPVGGSDVDLLGWAETEDPFALTAGALRDALDGRDPRAVGVSDRTWTVHALQLASALRGADGDVVLHPAGQVLRPLRAVKTPAEIDALRDAGRRVDAVHERLATWRLAGRRERDVARDLAEALVEAGHAHVDFVIVASGPNGASPHHEPDDRVIARGDVVVVDIGGTTPAGYCSDSTRTYAVGEPDPDAAAAWRVLRRAQQAGVDAVEAGATCASVDAAARQVLVDADLGQWFVHRTGHGIGLETHEDPYLVEGNDTALAVGHAFSVEPGVYLPGRFGLRLEDVVVLGDDGPERLNRTDRALVALEP